LNCPDIVELLTEMEDVATLPATIVDLLYLLDNPVSSADNVQKVLERDVAMTANILKLGNSAYYGSRRQISSVRQAIVLMGNRSVATLAFAAGMAPVMRRNLKSYNLMRDDFWDHCLISAAASSLAADQLGLNYRRCDAFTVGLVHDIGMLIIDAWFETQDQVLDLADDGFHDYRRAEKECLGFDHTDVGASLVRRWGFPEFFADVMVHHHDYIDCENHISGETVVLTRAVAAGNLMADLMVLEMESAGDEEKTNLSPFGKIRTSLQVLGIDADAISELRLDLTENLEETLASATRCTVLN